MASNPMQKKARNSFLLGMVITLVLVAILGAMVFFMVIKPKQDAEKQNGKVEVTAYVLSQDIKSGQIVTSNLLQPITVYENMVPANYVNQSLMNTMELQDKEGNILYTNTNGEYYIMPKNSNGYKLISGNNNKGKVLISEDVAGYYKTKENGDKEYIEFLSVPLVAKINMSKNSILTIDSITKSDEVITDDLRNVEYNMLTLPTNISEGDFVDVRLVLPNGQDFIVVSKKEVKSILGNTIGLSLTEGEIVMMESAIVESYIMTASKLYVTQYVDSGLQAAAVKTYVPTPAVQDLIKGNENIVNTAKSALQSRFDEGLRAYITVAEGSYEMNAIENLEEGITQEIQNARAAREAYLDGLTSYSNSN